MGSDITAIVLTYNEEIHIQRCLENIQLVAKEVFVVDCFSTDQTKVLASNRASVNMSGCSVHFVEHVWPGNQAEQLNWALDNLPIKTTWVLRLDADEYLTDELRDELREKLNTLDESVAGVVFPRRRVFLGRIIRRGMPTIKLLRLFRFGKGRCEERMMDEHIQLLKGQSVEFSGEFVDDNLNNLSWWSQKHVGYAIREASDLLSIEYGLESRDIRLDNKYQRIATGVLGQQAAKKRIKKLKYARMPLFWRALAYFCMRYFVRGGFLEGKEGFLWHFLQGLWYRTLVDAKILEIKRRAGQKGEITPENILLVLRVEYGMKV